MSGVDHVIQMGVADGNRMGIMGWSNGGLVTSWVITQTNRFKAASVGAGFPELFSQSASNPAMSFDLGAEFWNDTAPYLKYSPIFYAREISAATLIQHGEQDTLVPITQGYLLYNVLKRRGIPTKMAVYPNAGHVPQSPKQVMDIAKQNVAWFNKYLKEQSQGK
jgi:dipeptidyl aminopeptidase/acylaminoacyl peptidase